MSTPHNSAKLGDIAKNVIMSGDPLRAKFISETYLTDVKQVNDVRGMLAYTGMYKDKQISVMGHGMGMPSACIYFHELFTTFEVENIIRVGSCGAMDKNLQLFDTIVVENAMTDSNIYKYLGVKKNKLPSTKSLFEKVEVASKNFKNVVMGDIYTSDVFYTTDSKATDKFAKKGALGVEMECFGLFAEAKRCNKNAMAIITVSDIIGSAVQATPEQRQKSFNTMIELALESIIL